MAKYVFLAFFLISVTVHLCACWKEGVGHAGTVRRWTKPLLVTTLLAYYLTASTVKNPFMIAALLTGWLGDVLLRWFLVGGTSFLISHIFYMISYAGNVEFELVSVLPVLLAGAVYLTTAVLVLRRIRQKLSPAFGAGLFLYLLVNMGMNLFALMQLLCNPCLATALVMLGAVLFYVSDSILFLHNFRTGEEDVPKPDFLIMSTYIFAQFFITHGILLLN